MDRIGAIKEAMRLENRPVATSAPVPFFRAKLLLLIVLVSALWGCDSAFASVSACANISYVPGGSFFFNGCSRDFAYEYCAFWTVAMPNNGVCTAVVNLNTSSLGVAWNGTFVGSVPFSKLGTYSCPAGTYLVGSMCEIIPVEEFDPVAASAFWAFGFAGVMILYFSSHVIGLVLKAIKNG